MIENGWKPSPKQEEFLAIPHSIKEGFYAGAVHAGKTDVLLTYPIMHRFHENPKFKGFFFRRTIPEHKLEVIPRSKLYYNPLGAEYNKNDKIWTFPSGALIFFCHCENEDDVHNYDSAQPNYVAFDELTSFTEWQYLYITLQRCRTQVGNPLPAIVRSASNPGNIGHNWVRRRFIDPSPDGRVIIEGKSGIKRIFIPATAFDNPYTDPEYIKSLEALPEAEKQAKLYGKWDAYEGSVFSEFRDRHYPDEPENAIHVVDPFDIPSWWPRIVAIDWGFAAMTWVGYGAISPDRKLFIYREQSWVEKKIEEWAPYVKEFIDKENPRTIKVCRSAGAERGQEHTIHQQINNALERSVELTGSTSGSRVSGKLLVHEYLRFKPKYVPKVEARFFDEEKSQFLLRNKGIREYKAYLDSFSPPEEEKNLPKLQIFNNCKLLINAIKSCVYDKTNPEDVAEFPGDDPYDGLRYLVDSADRYFEESEFEFKKLQEQEALVKALAETNDWTSYYRNAQRIENEEFIKPVKRFHHAAR